MPLKGPRENGRSRAVGRGAALAVLALCASPVRAEEAPTPVVARVGDAAITAVDFQREMSRRGLGRDATAGQKDALLEEMVRLEALAARARQLGLDKDPEIASAVRKMLAGRVLAAELEPTLRAVTVDDAQVQAYYQAHLNEFTTPERRRAALIRVHAPPRATPAARAQLHARAEQAAREASGDEKAFRAAAAKFSDDVATRYTGGDQGWMERGAAGGLDPAVAEALFALPAEGATSGVVAGRDAFFVLRLLDREESAARPLAQVQGAIRQRLIAARRQAITDEYHAKVKSGLAVTVDPAAARAVEATEPRERRDDRPPALPGKR